MPVSEFTPSQLIERLSERSLDFLENLISTCPGINELRSSITQVIKDDCDRYDLIPFITWIQISRTPDNTATCTLIIRLSEILLQTIDDIQHLASEVIDLIPQAYTDDILVYSRRLAAIISLVDAFIVNILNLMIVMITNLNKSGNIEIIPQEIDLCIHSAACVIDRLTLLRISK